MHEPDGAYPGRLPIIGETPVNLFFQLRLQRRRPGKPLPAPEHLRRHPGRGGAVTGRLHQAATAVALIDRHSAAASALAPPKGRKSPLQEGASQPAVSEATNAVATAPHCGGPAFRDSHGQAHIAPARPNACSDTRSGRYFALHATAARPPSPGCGLRTPSAAASASPHAVIPRVRRPTSEQAGVNRHW